MTALDSIATDGVTSAWALEAQQSPHTTTAITATMLPSMRGLAPEEQMGAAQDVLGITASSGSRRPAAIV
jgi:hypothetical protein